MLDPLPIIPFTRPARGTVTLPGSKSITNRALLLAALCDAPVTLTNALFSDDTEIMAGALNALGITVTSDAAAATMQVAGRGGSIPADAAELFVANAGTAARFLTALCAAAPRGVYRLDGVAQMRRRPMKGLIDALRALGADIRCPGADGFFPLEIRARGLRGGAVSIDAGESSQMLSALLMAAPLAQSEIVATLTAPVREPFVEMTVQLMHQFGVDVARRSAVYRVPRRSYRLAGPATGQGGGRNYPIEPDATAAGYFLALPLVAGGKLKLVNVTGDSLQGDAAFARVLRAAGLSLSVESASFVAGAARGGRHGVTRDFRKFSDTFLTLAAIAPLLEGPTRITGIAHTRKQETDRVAGAARELRRLGQDVVEDEDALTITPRPLTAGVDVETYGDHRFAMSFAILGCHNLHGDGRPWLSIKNPGCCAKTFPGFFDVLETVRRQSHGTTA
jgi:3-phosphoshikimate 1-carboxyvinyltransferase